MKKTIIIIGMILMLVIAGAFVYSASSGNDWTNSWEVTGMQGEWEVGVTVTYSDGTSEELSDLDAFTLLDIHFFDPDDPNAKTIESLIYHLKAKATGDYNTCVIDFTNCNVEVSVMKAATTFTLYEKTNDMALTQHTMICNGIWYQIYSFILDLNETHSDCDPVLIDAIRSNPWDDGYHFGFRLLGDIKFRGGTESEWETMSLPGWVSMVLFADEDVVNLVLSGYIEVTYA